MILTRSSLVNNMYPIYFILVSIFVIWLYKTFFSLKPKNTQKEHNILGNIQTGLFFFWVLNKAHIAQSSPGFKNDFILMLKSFLLHHISMQFIHFSSKKTVGIPDRKTHELLVFDLLSPNNHHFSKSQILILLKVIK